MGDRNFQDQRVEMARREAGRTKVHPLLARSLALLFLLILCSVPAAEHIAAFRDYAAGQRRSPLPQAYEVFSLLSTALSDPANSAPSGGILARVFTANRSVLKAIEGFEEALDDQSVVGKWIRPKMQYLLAGWLGVGNEKAYCGENPWLFYRPGVDYLTGPPFLSPRQLRKRMAGGSEWVASVNPDPRGAIFDFKEQLEQRGIALIVMPTPIKPMIHPEKLSRLDDPLRSALQNPSYERFKAELAQKGVLLFDAAPLLTDEKRRTGRDQYLMTDTHWRPEAMALVAEKLKDFIQERIPLPAVPDPGYRAEGTEREQLGDLAVMLDLPGNQQIFPREKISLRKVLENNRQASWKPQETADVLVLGDSFSNMYSLEAMGWGQGAGFVEQLSYLLKRPLDRITRNDNGSYATREFLASEMAKGRDRLSGKRLVIYQFAIRELSVGDWKQIDLKPGASQETKFLKLSRGEERIVQGRVEAVSAVPRPGTVPYKDHVMAIHLKDLAVDGRPLAETDAVVYMRSMTDHVWTPAARYRPGDGVELRLRAWWDVAGQYEGMNRSELDEPELQFVEPCWGEPS